MNQWIKRPLLGLHIAGAAVLALIVVVVIYDVTGRLLFNQPFAGTAELGGAGLVLLTFMQAPYAIREGKLLRVTYFVDRLPPWARKALEALAWVVGASLFLVFAVTGWEPALESLRNAEFYGNDAFRLPAVPLRFASLALWLIGAFACIAMLVQTLRPDTAGQGPDHLS